MSKYRIPTELEPRLIQASSTMGPDGLVHYVTTTQRNSGSRIVTESWGYASPTCAHAACRWMNLALAVHDWAHLTQPHSTGGEHHQDVLAFAPDDPTEN